MKNITGFVVTKSYDKIINDIYQVPDKYVLTTHWLYI